MREDLQKTKSAKLFALTILLAVFCLCILSLLIYDFANPISAKELTKSAASRISNAVDKTVGAKGKLFVKYIDTDGNELAEAQEFEGIVGEEYALERMKISGYKAYGEEPYSKTGNFTDDDIYVVFVYQNETDNVELEQDDHSITVKVKTEKAPTEYSLKIISKDEKGNTVKGLKYDVEKGEETIREGVVEGDSFVAGTITINQDGFDNYSISEKNNTYYEPLFGTKVDFKINKKWNNTTGQYEISIDYDKTIEGLNIEIDGSEIIVTLTHKYRDVIIEYGEEPKAFDLEITKYINKIIVDNGKNTKEITRTIENKDSILKLEIPPKELQNTIITVTYSILVENVGEVSGYATEITDYIPENFSLVEDENWTLVSDKAITSSLANTKLKPGDKKEIEIKFIWNIGNDDIGLRTNIVKATKVNNEKHIDDKTPTNTAQAMAIVTVSTGRAQRVEIIALIVLSIIAVVVYKEKRRINK